MRFPFGEKAMHQKKPVSCTGRRYTSFPVATSQRCRVFSVFPCACVALTAARCLPSGEKAEMVAAQSNCRTCSAVAAFQRHNEDWVPAPLASSLPSGEKQT